MHSESYKITLLDRQAFALSNFRGALIQELVKRGHKVFAFAPDFSEETKSAVEALGAEPIPYSMSRAGKSPIEDLKNYLLLVKKLKKLKPHVVFAFGIKPIIYGLWGSANAGIHHRLAMIEGLGHVFIDSGKPSLRRNMIRKIVVLMYRMSLSKAEKVIVLNSDDKKYLESKKMVDPGKLIQIDGIGVDLKKFVYTVPTYNPVTFMLAARLIADKGIFEYVEAAKILKKRGYETRVILLGEIDQNPSSIKKEQLQSWVGEGLIEWPGHVADMAAWLGESSVYVLPSYREGLPRSIQEAMAVGRAIITTNVPGCRQTVIDGVNGFLVPRSDPESLANAMQRFIEKPELIESMGKESRKLAENKYDEKVNTQEILKILESTLNAPV